jgi:tetratricopeptide (TPR) repeat protein
MQRTKKKNWDEIEAAFWSVGSQALDASLVQDPEVQVFLARVGEFNYRKAEALSLTHPIAGLQQIRTLLSRGHFEQAEKSINEYTLNSPDDPEIILDKARLTIYQGLWQESIGFCNKVMEYLPTGISRMSALQLRALSNFELGNFDKALQDIESIKSLALLYPKAMTYFYAKLLNAKTMAHRGFLNTAKMQLNMIWQNELINKSFDLVKVFVLLRAEIDVKRLEGSNPVSAIEATYLLANAMGDRLYAALARVDLYFAKNNSEEIKTLLDTDRKEFQRVDLLFQEVIGDNPTISSTAKSIRSSFISQVDVVVSTSLSNSPSHLIIPKYNCIIQMSPFRVQHLKQTTQTIRAASSLAKGKMAKKDFFSMLWGKQKYVSRIHDGLIHQLLFSIRKTLGIKSSVVEGQIIITDVLTVDL